MKRDLKKELAKWKNQPSRLPLLLRGARQVGKSYLIKEFGTTHFEHFVEINFEYEPEMKACFSSLDPHEILNKIRLLKGAKITPDSTLLFLDEMQECPEAILAFRYFYEKMPELHVIGAGSLLEFIFHKEDFRMPVGRVQYLFVKPLSFGEFLTALGHEALREYLKTVSLNTAIDVDVHNLLLKFVRQYLLIGGMPKVVDTYLQSKDLSEVQKMQTVILTTYRDDFGKYAESFEIKYLSTLFTRVPRLVSQRFFYKDVDPDLRARELKRALEKLQEASLIYKSYAVSAAGIPLGALINEKEFKLFFVDIGLVNRASGLGADITLEKDIIFVNRGALAEQFVAQELVAYSSPYDTSELYWWSREKSGSSAEVDFVITQGETLLPIEVKAGSVGRLRSLKIFLEEKKSPFGIRISQNPLELEKRAQECVLSMPFYLIEELPRVIKETFDFLRET
jgi:predicted AAA+ superfamily ATPase